MKRKNTILMVDYYGVCDKNGKAIGHSPKIAKEYISLIRDEFKVDLMVSPCLFNEEISKTITKCYKLKYDIIEDGNLNLKKRIIDKYKIINNMFQARRQFKNYDIVWFYRTDFFLFLFIFLFVHDKKTKLVGLVYQKFNGCKGLDSVLKFIFNKGIKKMQLVFSTGEKLNLDNKQKNYVIPDYYYSEELYGIYHKVKKIRKVVCLGTMSPYKKLESLVEVFNELDIELEIIGRFSEIDRVQALKSMAKKNIKIENCILTNDQYYKKLAEAEYSILPYDMNQYKERTSGVLLESIFVNTIPIAPLEILKYTHIPGIGYKDLKHFSMNDLKIDFEQYRRFMETAQNDLFNKHRLGEIIINGLREVIDDNSTKN